MVCLNYTFYLHPTGVVETDVLEWGVADGGGMMLYTFKWSERLYFYVFGFACILLAPFDAARATDPQRALYLEKEAAHTADNFAAL